MKAQRNENGFTMIEMMAVIGIIAILTAIVVPVYTGYQKRSERDQVRVDLMSSATIVNSQFGGNPASFPAELPEEARNASNDATLTYTTSYDRSQYCLKSEDDKITLYYSSGNRIITENDCTFTGADATTFSLDFIQTNQNVDVIRTSSDTYAQVAGYFQWGTVPGATRYSILELENGTIKYEHDLSTKAPYDASKATPGKLGYSSGALSTSNEDQYFSTDGTPVTRTPIRQFDLDNDFYSTNKSYKVRAYGPNGVVLKETAAVPMSSPASGLFRNTYSYNGETRSWAGVQSTANITADNKYFERTMNWSNITTHAAYPTVKKYIIADSSGHLDSANIYATLNRDQTTYKHTQRLYDSTVTQDPYNPGKYVDTDLALYIVADSNNDGVDETYMATKFLNMNSFLTRNAPGVTVGAHYLSSGTWRTPMDLNRAGPLWAQRSELVCYYNANDTQNFRFPEPTLWLPQPSNTSEKYSFSVTTNTYDRCHIVTEFLPTGKKYASVETLDTEIRR